MIEGKNRPHAYFGRRPATVTAVELHGPYVVVTAVDDYDETPIAGQFYMLQTERGWGGGSDGRPYLPRALSFARAENVPSGIALEFLLEDVGPGTNKIASLEIGAELQLTGPFGNGFAVDGETRPLLVAGGIGLAPIIALADEIKHVTVSAPKAFVGMRSSPHTTATDAYDLECEFATEDGSRGHHGYVTELLAPALVVEPASTVYACGPPAMLEAVRALCEEHGVVSQLAMESGMACGFGACYGCVVPTKNGFTRLCVDGPVLEGADLDTAIVTGAGH